MPSIDRKSIISTKTQLMAFIWTELLQIIKKKTAKKYKSFLNIMHKIKLQLKMTVNPLRMSARLHIFIREVGTLQVGMHQNHLYAVGLDNICRNYTHTLWSRTFLSRKLSDRHSHRCGECLYKSFCAVLFVSEDQKCHSFPPTGDQLSTFDYNILPTGKP